MIISYYGDLTPGVFVINEDKKDEWGLGQVQSSINDKITINFDSKAMTNVDINSGSIDGVTIGTGSVCTDLRVDNIKIDGNSITSTDTNGNIILNPNGTGSTNITGPLSVSGDLTINGTTTTINSTTITVEDPIITLGGDTDSSSNNSLSSYPQIRLSSPSKMGPSRLRFLSRSSFSVFS